MCTGAELIPLAASVAGSVGGSILQANQQNDMMRAQQGFNEIANNQNLAAAEEERYQRALNDQNVSRAMNAERDATLRRMDQNDATAAQAFQRAAQNVQPQRVQQDMQQAQDGRMALFDSVAPGVDMNIQMRDSAPQVVRDSASGAISGANARARTTASNAARVGSFSEMFGNNAFNTGIEAQNMGSATNASKRDGALLKDRQTLAGAATDRSSAIRPAQFTQPGMAGPGLPVGQALQGLSMLGAQAAGRGAFNMPAQQVSAGQPVNLLPANFWG